MGRREERIEETEHTDGRRTRRKNTWGQKTWVREGSERQEGTERNGAEEIEEKRK